MCHNIWDFRNHHMQILMLHTDLCTPPARESATAAATAPPYHGKLLIPAHPTRHISMPAPAALWCAATQPAPRPCSLRYVTVWPAGAVCGSFWCSRWWQLLVLMVVAAGHRPMQHYLKRQPRKAAHDIPTCRTTAQSTCQHQSPRSRQLGPGRCVRHTHTYASYSCTHTVNWLRCGMFPDPLP
jgi:hypothetical protein